MRPYLLCVALAFLLTANRLQAQEAESATNSKLKLEWLTTGAEALPVESGTFMTLPQKGLFLEDDGTFYSLDSLRCPDLVKFRLKARLNYEQVVAVEDGFLVKSRELVTHVHGNEVDIVAELDTETFFLHAGSGSKYHLVVWEEDDTWGWYTCNWQDGSMECVVRTQEPISHILDNGESSLFITDKTICDVMDDTVIPLTEMDEAILDAAPTTQGLFFCTPTTLYFYGDAETPPRPVLRGDFHSVHFDGGVLYVVLNDGRILKGNLADIIH